MSHECQKANMNADSINGECRIQAMDVKKRMNVNLEGTATLKTEDAHALTH